MTRKIDPAIIPDQPELEFESALWNYGCCLVGGVDEAGRGSLAGPVSAAIVILNQTDAKPSFLAGVLDSKQLNAEQREGQRIIIEQHSLDWAVGFSSNIEIDQIGIVPATRLAIQRSIDKLDKQPDHLLVDYLVLPDNPLPQTRLVKGDARSLSIAAASILAKTYRDAWMIHSAQSYPHYGFERNLGYGTAGHRQAIVEYGPCPLHRFSFAPLALKEERIQAG